MDANALDLSRLQFAFTVAVHIIFPALSIGLASFLAVLEACYLKTGKPHYKTLCMYWASLSWSRPPEPVTACWRICIVA